MNFRHLFNFIKYSFTIVKLAQNYRNIRIQGAIYYLVILRQFKFIYKLEIITDNTLYFTSLPRLNFFSE